MKVTAQQIEAIKSRCHTETLRHIGSDLGLDERRVGEILKILGITRRRWGRGLRPFESLYHVLLQESKRGSRDIPVELSFKQFLVFTKEKTCHYCGVNLVWSERQNRGIEPFVGTNLDRKNNKLGYTEENCVPCCVSCNRTKGDRYTYEEFLLIAHVLRLVQYLRKPLPKTQLNFMHTYSGKQFRYLAPDPEDIDIIDIAHALSQINRFVGQTLKPYSVAQHSVLVSRNCPVEHMLYGLLHDASEAYVTDVCRVLKLSPGMGVYKWYENRTMEAICKKFSLPATEPKEVKHTDSILLVTEKRDLFVRDCQWALNKDDMVEGMVPLAEKIEPWSAEVAERKFLERFAELKSQ